MIRLFEAFSGYGSQALTMKRYGIQFESVGIAEIDKYAIQAHEALHGPIKNYGDVSILEVDELPDMDLFTYSFPCQDISNAGKQRGLEKGSGTRSSLLWECERIIEGKRPKFLMMENVKNLVGKKNKPHFDEWLQVLESLGYNNYWKVINAKWCGVPQNRERVFCVSIRKDVDNGLFNFYEDFDNGIRLKDILETEVDEKYYLSEEIQSRFKYRPSGSNILGTTKGENNTRHGQRDVVYDTGKKIGCLSATDYKQPKQILVKEATKKGYKEAYPGDSINLEHPNSNTRRGRVGVGVANCLTTSCNQAIVEPKVNEIGLLNTDRHSSCMNTIHGTDRICRTLDTMQGGNRHPKILEADGFYSGTSEAFMPKPMKGISKCLKANKHDASVIENNYRIRKLTPYECLILMGLTHEEAMLLVNSGISNSQLYKMAGNSIVVQCMRFLKKLEATNILNEDKPTGQLSLF